MNQKTLLYAALGVAGGYFIRELMAQQERQKLLAQLQQAQTGGSTIDQIATGLSTGMDLFGFLKGDLGLFGNKNAGVNPNQIDPSFTSGGFKRM